MISCLVLLALLVKAFKVPPHLHSYISIPLSIQNVTKFGLGWCWLIKLTVLPDGHQS